MIDPIYDVADFGILDLSVDNLALSTVDVNSSSALAEYIDTERARQGTLVLVGGYLECRNIYRRSGHFGDVAIDQRDIHLGLDIWVDAGTSIHAVRAGKVHSMQDNTGLGNYGPTVILEHFFEGAALYSLYGHLSMASLDHLSPGQVVTAGQIIGWLGDRSVNGDYPPHLHLQFIKDLGSWHGDYPGVSSRADLSFYESNCPDPIAILKMNI